MITLSTFEIREWETDKSWSRRKFVDQISSLLALSDVYGSLHANILEIPRQEIVIGDYLHLLLAVLKYGPIILAPDESCGGFILMQIKRKIKVFSLQSGDFVDNEALDLQKSYTAFSVTETNLKSGRWIKKASDEALDILEKTTAKWESKLMLTPLAYRQTIREAQKADKMMAADDEMIAEGIWRLSLLGLENLAWSLDDGAVSAFLQEKRRQVSVNEPEPIVVDEEQMRYYEDGFRKGFQSAYKKYNMANDERPLESLDYLFPSNNTSIVRYKDTEWFLASNYDEDWDAYIKKEEENHGFKVYCVIGYPLEHVFSREPMLSMLYVSRNMSDWEAERQQTEAGTPQACLKILHSEVAPKFDSVGIRAVKVGCRYTPFRTF